MEHPKFCPHCGTPVVGEMKFCTSCGKAVVSEAPPTPAVATSTKKSSPAWAYILITCLFLWAGWHYLLAPAMQIATRYDVTYHISGTARAASLTLQNANNASEQRDGTIPWDLHFSAHGGQFVYVSAQNKAEFGTVKCEILLNGVVVQSAESDTAYGIATCSGRL